MNPIVEKRFEYKGYPCVVMFMLWGCHRCGYVWIMKGLKYYGKEYDELVMIDCNGGLTYAEDNLFGQDDKDMWWIGFDCAHAWDARDFKTGRRYAAADPEELKSIEYLAELDRKYDTGGEVRTLEYVEAECKRILDQLEELANDR